MANFREAPKGSLTGHPATLIQRQTVKWGCQGPLGWLGSICTAVSFSGDGINWDILTEELKTQDSIPLWMSKWLKWLSRGRRNGFLYGASKGRIKANGAATAWRKSLVQHNEELSNNQSQLTMEEECLRDCGSEQREAGSARGIPAPDKGCTWSSPELATLFEGPWLLAKISCKMSCMNLGFWQGMLSLRKVLHSFCKELSTATTQEWTQKRNNHFLLLYTKCTPPLARKKE